MERIPEKELMDTEEQARAYADTDFSEAHDAFVAYFKSRFPDFYEGDVLDLGCGSADVIIRFAGVFPRTVITGVDGSQSMIDIGLRDIASEGLSHRITLEKWILPGPGLPDRRYDALISNSLLHHLKDPAVIWDAVKDFSKRGSPVFIMDLLRPDSVNLARELVKLHASDAAPLLQEDFFNSLLAAYSEAEIRQQLIFNGLDYFHVEKVSDRHIIIWGTYL